MPEENGMSLKSRILIVAVIAVALFLPAMGLWQCRERYQTQQQLLDVVKEFRKRQIPLDNIVQDWFYWPEDKWGDHDFDAARYPNPLGDLPALLGWQ
jgi:hypothetical protein